MSSSKDRASKSLFKTKFSVIDAHMVTLHDDPNDSKQRKTHYIKIKWKNASYQVKICGFSQVLYS